MKNYKEFFKGKKVTCLGLGLLGGMLNDAIFLADCGAELTITDLKSEADLAQPLKKLAKYNKPAAGRAGIKYVFGRHDLADFKGRDFILQPGNVPVDSPYLLEAQKNNIPIHESESLFFQYLPAGVKTIGITGTRGKTTTTRLIYEILKSVFGRKVHLAGNIQGKSTLALLGKIKAGDLVVMELDSWCLHGIGEIKLPDGRQGKSPNISVFTNLLPDHLNFYLRGLPAELGAGEQEKQALQKYFEDKAQIYQHQSATDFLICGEKISQKIGKVNGHKIVVAKKIVPKGWKIKVPGDHNLENIACAIKACEAAGLSLSQIRKGVEHFGGVEGRLELIREYRGIKIYNDTTATTPDATIMALRALGNKKKNIVLIMGGADKKLDMAGLVKEIPKYCRAVFLLDGTGSAKLNLKKRVCCADLAEAVRGAIKESKKGDTLLFSPAFASFGMFANEYDRGDKFNRLIKVLK